MNARSFSFGAELADEASMFPRATMRWTTFVFVFLATACSGEIGDRGANSGDPDDRPINAFDPGPSNMRRLTKAEYLGTVEALFGIDPALVADMIPEDSVSDGFNNNAQSQTISFQHTQAYQQAAEAISAAIVTDAMTRERFVGCDLDGSDRAGCLRSFVTSFGRSVFRRPLETAEIDRFVTRFGASVTTAEPYADVDMIVRAALQSPKFLFRVERGAPDPEHDVRVRLDGYEIASRLSFLLWQHGPDAWLLDQAESGALDDADGIEAVAREMLDAPEARDALRNFSDQWFHIDKVADTAAPLRDSMVEEMRLLVDDYMWREGADLLDGYTSDYSFVNASLAQLYGVSAPGSGFGRVTFTADDERGGLLTTAGFLTVTSKADRTFLTKRGKYVRDMVLCDPVPPPPRGVVPTLPMPNESEVEVADRHANDPMCAGCHVKLDPIGRGLEMYDHLGELRDVDEFGNDVRLEGYVEGIADNAPFMGGVALGRMLRDEPATAECAVRQIFRWSFGRSETGADQPAIELLAASFGGDGHNFEELVVALVRSDAFRHRRSGDAP